MNDHRGNQNGVQGSPLGLAVRQIWTGHRLGGRPPGNCLGPDLNILADFHVNGNRHGLPLARAVAHWRRQGRNSSPSHDEPAEARVASFHS